MLPGRDAPPGVPGGPISGPSHLYCHQFAFKHSERDRKVRAGPSPTRKPPPRLFPLLHIPTRRGERRPVSLIKRENVAGNQMLNLIRPFWGRVWHRDPHLSPSAAPLLARRRGGARRGRIAFKKSSHQTCFLARESKYYCREEERRARSDPSFTAVALNQPATTRLWYRRHFSRLPLKTETRRRNTGGPGSRKQERKDPNKHGQRPARKGVSRGTKPSRHRQPPNRGHGRSEWRGGGVLGVGRQHLRDGVPPRRSQLAASRRTA